MQSGETVWGALEPGQGCRSMDWPRGPLEPGGSWRVFWGLSWGWGGHIPGACVSVHGDWQGLGFEHV